MKTIPTRGRTALAASLFATLSLGLFAAPATNVTSAVRGGGAPAPAGKDTFREQGTDEIDLEEIDDAALAAKGASVRSAAQSTEYVDISCDEATLADILRQFRKTTRANIISDNSSNLQQRVSAELKHVPWLEALESILGTRGYTLEERKGIYFVKEQHEVTPVFTRPYSLKHASSSELAALFNESYAPKDAKGKILVPIANAFEAANVVVVKAPDSVHRDCEKIIESVDKAVPQVYIEARFLELSSEALHKLGLQWDSLESWRVTASDMKGGWQSVRGTPANYGLNTTKRTVSATGPGSTVTEQGSSTETTTTTTGTKTEDTLTGLVPGSIGEATAAGLTAADMAWEDARGFSGQLSAQDFSLALSAFESLGEGRIFSNPKVIVSNGKTARVDMTTKFPNIELMSSRNSSASASYLDMSARLTMIPGEKDRGLFAGDTFYSWGIMLTVKPIISQDGQISVVIEPMISQLDTDVSSSGFYQVQGSSDTAIGSFPIIDMKRIMTEFTMKNGATAVIGGLSRTVEEDVDTGIPYLRKIPWIGQKIFGWKSRQKVQKEIIVCVTIGIADPGNLPKDIGLPTNAVLGREYVNGNRLEPGLREGGVEDLLKIDKRAVEKISSDKPGQKKADGKNTGALKPGEVRMSSSK